MEKEKSQKSLVVIIILLILMVLGLGGYITYDKIFTNKEDKNNKNNKEETKTEEVLSLDSLEVKKLYFPTEIFSEGAIFDSASSKEFDVTKDTNSSLLYKAAKILSTTTDFEDEYNVNYGVFSALDYNNADEQLGLLKTTVYISEDTLKDKFLKLFGPNIAFKPESIEFDSCTASKKNNLLYDNSNKQFSIKPCYCPKLISYIPKVYYEKYKVTKLDDTISVYMYNYSVVSVSPEKAGQLSPACIVKTDNVELYNAKQGECDANLIDNLKAEGKIKTYKVTYKKQSDGNYYIIKGEWQ